MTPEVRQSDVMQDMQAAMLARPPFSRQATPYPKPASIAMEIVGLSSAEREQVRQMRGASQNTVPTLKTTQEPAHAHPPYTCVRDTAAQADTTTRWQRFKARVQQCWSAPKPAAPKPTVNSPSGWVLCNPAVPVCDIDGLRAGFQVRTTDGMDVIYGTALPTDNDNGQMVTMYRDLGAMGD